MTPITQGRTVQAPTQHDKSATVATLLTDRRRYTLCGKLSPLWNPVSNARPAESGTQLRWTNLPDDARAMWKTARSAASRMCCGLSTTIRHRNFSLPRNWSEEGKDDFGPLTCDF